MGNPRFHSLENEEGKLAKIPGDGDPLGPHWELYSKHIKFPDHFNHYSANVHLLSEKETRTLNTVLNAELRGGTNVATQLSHTLLTIQLW